MKLRLEVDPRQQIDNPLPSTDQALILVDTQQHMRQPTAVGH
ncbi:hypothetical protein ACLIIZ_17605 [Azonexus caeni]|jgi:hypothetical protein